MSRPTPARCVAALPVALAVACSAGVSLAQPRPKPPPEAQSLFDEANAALDRKDYNTACPKLEEVVRLVPDGIGARLALAECYEGAGRLASAWAAYQEVEAAAGTQQPQRQKRARARAAALLPRLATLTIDVPERLRGVRGLEVLKDGVPVERAAWGAPVAIDKGAHTIRATAPGRTSWQTTIGIAADGVRVTIVVDGLLPDATQVGETAAPAEAKPSDASAEAKPSDASAEAKPSDASVEAKPSDASAEAKPSDAALERPMGAQKIAGLAIGALGVATLAAGGGFGVAAMVKKNQSESGPCGDDGRCTAEGLALRDEGRTFGNVSTALFIAGGAVAAAGIVLLVTAPSRPGAGADRPIGARLLVGPGHVAVQGLW